MSKSNTLLKYIVVGSGVLILLWGIVGLTLPVAQADIIVPLVRNTPTDDAYTLVTERLAQGMRNYWWILMALGLVNVISSAIDLRNCRKSSSIA